VFAGNSFYGMVIDWIKRYRFNTDHYKNRTNQSVPDVEFSH
jgi:hypothetical protein